MWKPAGYTLHENLYPHEDVTTTYRATRNNDGLPVIIKILQPVSINNLYVQRFKNAYQIAQKIKSSSLLKTLELKEEDGNLLLIFENFSGRPLDFFYQQGLELSFFIEVAINVTEALNNLHAEGVVHKDLRPKSILIDPDTGKVKITNLELASRIPREQQLVANSLLVEGSLPYMSPEQTGRTNQAVDQRSDLYSLGITFYEIYTGKLPFSSKDLLGWFHSHLAKPPPPLPLFPPPVAPLLGDIIAKLLAKAPEERYQTAAGLLYDLKMCKEMLSSHQDVTSFKLGSKDISEQFHISQKLYGRENQVSELLAAFDRVVNTATPEMILISGYAGIGKTALVRELYIPLAKERGFFLSGKFDQYKRGIPYSIFLQAFRDLILELLAAPEEQVKEWKKQLQEALGINAQLIVNFIPEVELLIGSQPPIPDLPLDETENRFQMVFDNFLNVFTKKEHPVSLFIDDLQWADLASLKLIEHILSGPEKKHLLLVGAYRSNEVDSTHPLTLTLENMKRSNCLVSTLELTPLSKEHVLELVTETVHQSFEKVQPLAMLIHQKTGGNPFFVIQFLRTLYHEELIIFDQETRQWTWDHIQIHRKSYTDNIVDLMIRQLLKFSPDAQETLEVAACIGNIFDMETLAIAREKTEDQVYVDLQEALTSGLVLRNHGTFHFLHDRILQAASSLLSEKKKQSIHLKIGRILFEHTTLDHLNERIFDIVSQLNQASSLIENQNEQDTLAQLNLMAGSKSRAAAAYDSAVSYLKVGIHLLSKDSWERLYPLSFGLYLELAQAEYLNKDFEEAEKTLLLLHSTARSRLELAAVYGIGIQLKTNRAEPDQSLELALEYLRLFKIEMKRTPSFDEVLTEIRQTLDLLKNKPIESILSLHPNEDPEIIALLDILLVTLPAAFIKDNKLWAMFTCQAVMLSLKNGNAASSGLAYVTFGAVLGSFIGSYEEGYRFGQVAVELVKNQPPSAISAALYFSFGVFIIPWKEKIQNSVPYFQEAIRIGTETGNITWACYASNLLITILLSTGESLDNILADSLWRLDFVRRVRFETQENGIITSQLFIQKMTGKGDIDEVQHVQRLHALTWPIEIFLYHVRQLQAHVILGEYEQALEAAKKAHSLIWTAPNFIQIADYVFYLAIAQAQLGISSELSAHNTQLRTWEKHCPGNFQDRACLISAEKARLKGQSQIAISFYEQAITAANKNGFLQNEALAYELAGSFYRASESKIVAKAYFEEARSLYSRWGAQAKVTKLEKENIWMQRSPSLPTANIFPGNVFIADQSHIDLFSIVKASQTISGKLEPGELSKTLMQIMMEYAGAQKGCLILLKDGLLKIEAIAILKGSTIDINLVSSLPLINSDLAPESIIRYAQRSGNRVVLANATQDNNLFKSDKYIVKNNPRSVLCLPIQLQKNNLGFLYLENTSISGLFTTDRIVTLELLTSQIAIAMENARLLSEELLARAHAEEDKQRALFIAEAGALLTESLEYEEVFDRLAKLIVRELAEWCEFDMVEGDRIQRRAGLHVDANKMTYLEQLAQRYPPMQGGPQPSARVLKSGLPLMISNISIQDLQQLCVNDDHLNLAQNLGTTAVLSVPLQTRGKVIGVITLASSKRQYTPADLSLVTDLAFRASMAIENARLYSEAQKAIRVRDDFLLIASHELKTPLSPLKMQLQLLTNFIHKGPSFVGSSLSDLLKLIENSEQQVDKLLTLVSSLLDVSRIESGRLSLNQEKFNLSQLIFQIVKNLKSDFALAKCPLEMHLDSTIVGNWDPLRIEQVITNLLTNALKYGVGHPIKIGLQTENSFAKIMIQDFGIGISQENQKRIFERFERAVSSKHFGGFGLGLYICSQIIKEHSGKIKVESELGKGSTFTVFLPLNPPMSQVDAI